VDILIKVGNGMHIKLNKQKYVLAIIIISMITINYSFAAEKLTNERTEMDIKSIWSEYIAYWREKEPTMTAPETCKPESKEDVEKLESYLGVVLPEDFKQSFQIVDHSRKKCDDNLDHSWLGSTTGIFLYNTKDVKVYHDFNLQYIDDLKYTSSKYFGDIEPHHIKSSKWPKEWIPFMGHNGITFCIDLRENLGNQYGQILAIYPRVNLGIKNNKWYTFIVWLAPNYTEFMKKILEDIKKENGLDDNYFRKLMHLPDGYYDDDWGV